MREPRRQARDEHVRRGIGGGRARGGRPRGSTRERILDIALDLFNEHGYDKTSLREIAEHLGFTKAALYYHFERKEDILLALHMRLHALGREILGQLEDEAELDVWVGLLDQFIDQVVANRKLFLLHARNQNALEQIVHNEDNAAEHEDMEEHLRRVLANPALPLVLRIRMACSIGAVMGALMGAGEAFSDVPPDELAGVVRDAAHDLLGVKDTQASPNGARGPARRTRRL